jgi:hypothetical protein
MMGLAIALEVARYISSSDNGIHVPPQKAGILKFAPTQFLTSFFPIALVAPLALLWQETDWLLKWYQVMIVLIAWVPLDILMTFHIQPYVVLAKGNVPAEGSLLLDYVCIPELLTVYDS